MTHHEARFPAMGTEAHVVVLGHQRLLDSAQARIEDLEAKWSRFRPTSEISQLNAYRGNAVIVSPETTKLVATAIDAYRMTEGRFDATVLGDMLRAGYDDTFSVVAVRGTAGVSLLRRGSDRIRIDHAECSVYLPADVGFDPGGIGKGLAADIVVSELRALGAHGVCINLGGDLRVDGEGPDDGEWTVALRGAAHDNFGYARLAAGGIATSTVAKRQWHVAGTVRHHVIDPRTGVSAQRRVVTATAIAGTAARAEVAATSALLAAPGNELAALTQMHTDGLIALADGDTATTAGFAAFRAHLATTPKGTTSDDRLP